MKTIEDIRKVAVLGAGTMGNGIAQVAAQAGFDVSMFDVSDELVGRGMSRIESMLQKGIDKGKVTTEQRDAVLSRITAHSDLASACPEADVVIEAAPEKLDLKQQIFGEVASHVADDTLLATNTSSLSVSKIAAGVPGAERVLGLHFFNPPPLMKLLEIVRGDATDEAQVELARAFAIKLGKDPIVVRDVAGFASSRLGIALGLEAIRMVEEGVASAADIDKAMELGYRHPMGPLKLTDLVGLDVRLAIARYLSNELDDRRFEPPRLLERMVEEGKLGKKSGEGFYTYP